MARPFTEKIKDSTWWLEQSAHGWIGGGSYVVVASCLIDLGVRWEWQVGAGIAAAALVGMFREIIQNVGDDSNDVLDSIADALFVLLGALIVAVPTIVGGLV